MQLLRLCQKHCASIFLLSSGLDTAEYFDVKAGHWKAMSSMSTRRSSVGVGVVGGKKLTYLLFSPIDNILQIMARLFIMCS